MRTLTARFGIAFAFLVLPAVTARAAGTTFGKGEITINATVSTASPQCEVLGATPPAVYSGTMKGLFAKQPNREVDIYFGSMTESESEARLQRLERRNRQACCCSLRINTFLLAGYGSIAIAALVVAIRAVVPVLRWNPRYVASTRLSLLAQRSRLSLRTLPLRIRQCPSRRPPQSRPRHKITYYQWLVYGLYRQAYFARG